MSDSKSKSVSVKTRGASAPLVGSRLEVSVEKLAIGGAGVARHEGLVIFIQQAAPQDLLLIEITKAKKNFAEAKIVKVLKPSPFRRQAPCPFFPECGGCNWQHIEESEQLKQKETLVKETLQKFLPDQSFQYLPIQKSPLSIRYRNRIQPKIKDKKFGFFARESHSLVEISDCLIAEKTLTDKMPEVRNWALQKRSEGRLEMYLDSENSVRYNFVDEEDDGVGFSQVNRFQNEDLIRTVLSWSEDIKYAKIHDLYSGAGNFSLPVSNHHQSEVTAVELSSKLVARGRQLQTNFKLHFIESDVEKYVNKAEISSNDLVILDPPRAGCSEQVMKKLAGFQPRKIIYISCHPVSLARDLKWFFEWSARLNTQKLKIQKVQAFEMFPQTDHVETIVELGVDS